MQSKQSYAQPNECLMQPVHNFFLHKARPVQTVHNFLSYAQAKTSYAQAEPSYAQAAFAPRLPFINRFFCILSKKKALKQAAFGTL